MTNKSNVRNILIEKCKGRQLTYKLGYNWKWSVWDKGDRYIVPPDDVPVPMSHQT